MRVILALSLFSVLATLCGHGLAQSTSGTLSTSDDSFTHPGAPMVGSAGGPRHYRSIEFNVTTTGDYTFTYTPSGYTGALYLYQGSFQPASPITNIWDFGDTGSPVNVTHNLSVPGKFEVVLTSTTNNAAGSWSLNISGPASLEMGPVIDTCSPSSGSTGGSTNVTISESFLQNVNNLTFGGSPVTNLTVVDGSTITCTTPSHSAGSVIISASKSTGGGLSGERHDAFTYNLTPTSVSSIDRHSPGGTTTNAGTVTFRVTFAASAGGLTTGNFDTDTSGGITGASVTGVSGSGTTWDVTVNTGSGDGSVRLDMVNDNNVNPSITNVPYTSGQSYTIDKTVPTVSDITRADANPTNASSVDFTVTFSESVSGVSTGNFALDASGVTGEAISGISGSGSSRTVTVSTGSGDGSIGLDLLNNLNSISDNAGNDMSSAFAAGEAYTVDKTAPTVSISAPSVSATSSGPVDFTITYGGATGISLAAGDVSLDTTGNATGSVSVAGSGTSTRTVTIGSITGDGTIGISIAAGTASDDAGNSAGAAGPSGTFTVTGGPSVSIGAPSVSLTAGGPVDFTVTYANATAVNLTSGDVTINGSGGVTGTAAVSGTGTTTRTVTVDGIAGDGSFTISIAADTASNGSGNAAAAGPSASVDVDNTDPGLTPGGAVSVALGDTAVAAAVGTVSDNLSAAGDLVVTATGLPTGFTVNNISNSGGTITADIATDSTATVGTSQVEFTVTDEAGNSATADLQVDVTANAPPTITAPADQVIQVNGSTGALNVSVDDADEGPNALTLTVDVDNTMLVDTTTGVTIGGTGGTRTIDIAPEANNIGVAVVTLTVTDSGSLSTTATFTLTVEDAANGPSITTIDDLTMDRDTTSSPIAFTVSDPQGAGTLMMPTVLSGDLTLVPASGLVIAGTGPDYTLEITPVLSETGTTPITVSISDGTTTFSRSFQLTVQEPGGSGGGGGDGDDDEDCSTSTGRGWMMLLALLAALVVGVRARRHA